MPHGRDLITGGRIILSGYVLSDAALGWIYDGETVICPQLVREALDEFAGREAVVVLNSMGGDPVAGEAIRSILSGHDGGVRLIVEGAAASAASLLMMGAARREMTAGSWLMIHDPSTCACGTAADLRARADFLDTIAGVYAGVYAAVTGQSVADITAMMDAETYMGPEDAEAAGFVHAVIPAVPAPGPATTDPAPAPVPANDPHDPHRAEFRLAMTAFATRLRGIGTGGAPSGARPVSTEPAMTGGNSPAPAAITMEAHMPDPITTPAPGQPTAITPTPPAAAPPAPVMAAQDAQAAVLAERQRGAAIRQMAAPFMAAGRLSEEDVAALIQDGTSADMAGSRLMATMAAREPVGHQAGPAPRGRDETETLRMALEDALVMRLQPAGHAVPQDIATDTVRMAAARDQMRHNSLVSMAVERLRPRHVPQTTAEREALLRMAFHSTSDFPILFENALNRSLAARYTTAAPTYRQISRQRSYTDFRAHTTVRPGDFPELQPVSPEGGEIKTGTFSEAKETTSVAPYAIKVPFSRQMIVNDTLGALAQILNDQGDAVARFEEKNFYAMVLTASGVGPTMLETGRAMFNTSDKTLAAAAAAITVASVGLGAKALMERTSKDGARLALFPSILLVGPAKWLEAQQLVTAVQAQQIGNVNPFSGALQVVSTPWIADNAWYLFAAPSVAPNFVWGLLDGYSAPRLRMDEPFGQQGVVYSLEHDFGCGAIDFRGGYRNAGA